MPSCKYPMPPSPSHLSMQTTVSSNREGASEFSSWPNSLNLVSSGHPSSSSTKELAGSQGTEGRGGGLRELGDVCCSWIMAGSSLTSHICVPREWAKISARVEQSEAPCVNWVKGKVHVKGYGVALSPARSCVWLFELTSMCLYQIWDLFLGD